MLSYMMLFVLKSIGFIYIIFLLVIFSFFIKPSRFSFFSSNFMSLVKSMLTSVFSFWVLYLLFLFLFLTNLIGNVPLSSIPTLFYSQTFTISLMFWSPIMICVSVTQFRSFLSHMLPYGSPAALMLFLPLVEIFSQLIRPLTLMIRLSTNLSSGHIMLYIFSYFTLLSDFLVPVIVPVLFILYILEICISMLQAYIFVTLLSLYVLETI